MTCKYSECGAEFKRKDLDDHYEECSEEILTCDACSAEYPRKLEQQHNCIKILKEEIIDLKDQLWKKDILINELNGKVVQSLK